MTITLSALQKQRWDTAANWTAENPTLLAGEIGLESDTGYWKVGDGSTAWTSLAYVSGLGAEIPVSRLADGTAGQIIQTDSAGTGVEWSSTTNLPLGSASAPAYRFQGDTNTGIYSPGADQLALSTNGTGRLFVDASGRVGVGTNPDGTSILAIKQQADTTNGGLVIYATDGTGAVISRLSDGGLTFRNGGSERLRITSAGLVGIGTSSPSSSALLDVNGNARIGSAGNFDTDTRLLLASTGGNCYLQVQGADSTGTAGIKFGRNSVANRAGIDWSASTDKLTFRTGGTSAAITVDSAQRVGIGTSTPSALLHTAGNALFVNSGDNLDISLDSTYSTIIDAQLTGASEMLVLRTNRGIKFDTGGTSERARIDSSGRLLVGTSSAQAYVSGGTQAKGIQIAGSSGETTAYTAVRYGNDIPGSFLSFSKSRGASIGTQGIVSNGDQLGFLAFHGSDGSNFIRAASITAEVDGTPGANDMPGRLVFSTTADGASSPTERMRIQSNGAVLIGKTSDTFSATGARISGGGVMTLTANSNELANFNRLTDDGVLLYFSQASTIEGSISVSGTTVSYNGAHLSRWSQLSGIDPYDKTARPEILRGTVMSNLDEMCDWTCPTSGDCQDNEQLNKTQISDVEGDKNVAGVFQGWDDDDDTWVNDFYLAMTGDFVIRIAAGTTVQRGDLLMSAGDGTAKPQDDDIIRSKTIAKVTSTNVSCTYDDGSYCVPCVLMAC